MTARRRGPSRTLVTMTPAARRSLAVESMLDGFRASGKNFHGETYDVEKYPSIERMLVAHFEGMYDRRELGLPALPPPGLEPLPAKSARPPRPLRSGSPRKLLR